ncbi:MAG: hypothetical protein JXQ29_12000 [Planctomycetes bacterium]|nr:hypothetical protein [Planctomycetota bacterium]
MRNAMWLGLGVALLLAVAAGAQDKVKPAEEEAPAPAAAAAESVAFMQTLVKKMDSPDARIRFAVREALLVMDRQAIAVLNEHRATVDSEHLKAFIDRTIERIKSMKTAGGRSWSTLRGRDLDRLAMECNLTLEQITQIQPILAKHDKNAQDLWEEFRQSGVKDKEAFKDLQDERNLLVEEAGPALRRYLSEEQVKAITAHLKGGGFGGGAAAGEFIMGGGGGGMTIIRRPPGDGEKGK